MDRRADEGSAAEPSLSPSYLVKSFHEIMGIHMPGAPDEWRLSDPKLVRKITSMLDQEVEEVKRELVHGDIEQLGWELADIVYSAFGAALELGIDLDRKVREVHQANLTRCSPEGVIIRDPDGKIEKGPSYKPPGRSDD
jgi:predicted HAD superfamily Cof-like phosphohydrolase